MKKYLFLSLPLVFFPKIASAHCPLCTAGAGALAVAAASLGVSSVIVGVLIGAFALALSLWISKSIKKQFIPFQNSILIIIIFLGTVIPIMPLVQSYGPLYVSLMGDYGTMFHNTYTINLYVLGVIIGVLIMLVSPLISKLITEKRNKQIPFQGIIITFTLLIVVSLIIQFLS